MLQIAKWRKVEKRETQLLFLRLITKVHAPKNGPINLQPRSCRPIAQSDMHRFSAISIRPFDGIGFQAPLHNKKTRISRIKPNSQSRDNLQSPLLYPIRSQKQLLYGMKNLTQSIFLFIFWPMSLAFITVIIRLIFKLCIILSTCEFLILTPWIHKLQNKNLSWKILTFFACVGDQALIISIN